MILVAGIGNVFLADDGFGVEVARRLMEIELPPQVTVVDYGIRGMHLAYDLLAGFDVTILIDAVPRGDVPGTIYVIDVTAAGTGSVKPPRQLDPHGMSPDAVLDLVRALGGDPGHVFVVGCEPDEADERIGLSLAVSAAVETAVAAVVELIDAQLALRAEPVALVSQPIQLSQPTQI